MSQEMNCPKPGEISWNELVAVDEAKAKTFYTTLFGWKPEPFGDKYKLFKQGDQMIGGMMQCPQPNMPSHWLAYVTVEDVDASVSKASKLGAKVCVDPMDIPTVGRIAVIADPQGAAIGLFKPQAMQSK